MKDKEMEKLIDACYDVMFQREAGMRELGLLNYGDSSYYIQNPDEYEKDQKIADLEAKLEEMQNEKDELISKYRYWKGECAELKQQLAEKDTEVQSWKDGTMVVKLSKLEEQLAEKEKKYEVLYKLFSEQHEIIDQYELECFEEVNRLLKEQKDFYVVEKDEYDKMVSGAKQFAKETAIAELEKVKKWANNMYDGWKSNDGVNLNAKTGICNTLKAVCGKVDQQIKSLKGEK